MEFITKKYNCETHGEVEYTARIVEELVSDGECQWYEDVDKTTPYCPTCAEEKRIREEKEHVEKRLAELNEKIRQKRHRQLSLPKRFKRCNFDNYLPTCKASQKNLETCRKYADKFEKVRSEGKGLILVGKVGTGKTHLACSIGSQLVEAGFDAKYTKVSEMVRRIRATWSGSLTKTTYDASDFFDLSGRQTHGLEEKTLSEQDVINEYVFYDLLIIDEVGVQAGTENERNLIFTIIDERYQEVKPTIIISNLTENELAPLISERSISRIKQGSGTLTFDWQDYRTKAA